MDLLVFQAELEVTGEAVRRPVDGLVLVQDALGRLSHRAGGADGRFHPQGLYQGDAVLSLQGLESNLHVTKIPLITTKNDDDQLRWSKNTSAYGYINTPTTQEKQCPMADTMEKYFRTSRWQGALPIGDSLKRPARSMPTPMPIPPEIPRRPGRLRGTPSETPTAAPRLRSHWGLPRFPCGRLPRSGWA